MSGCCDSEKKFPCCVHGVVGFCYKCENLQWKTINFLEEKISEKYAHSDVISRIERLEKLYNSSTEIEQLLLTRLKELESWTRADEDVVYDKLKVLENEINEIKNGLIRRVGILGEDLYHLSEENYKLRKFPHKCPICLGDQKILIDPATPLSGIEAMFGKRDINGMYYKDCKACNETGILWG